MSAHFTNGLTEKQTARASAGFWLGGSLPPCRLRRRNVWKFDYEMVHSEVYLNKYVCVVSTSPFSTPPFRKLLFFACFRYLIYHSFFQGVSWPHLPPCADAHAGGLRAVAYTASLGASCGKEMDRVRVAAGCRVCRRSWVTTTPRRWPTWFAVDSASSSRSSTASQTTPRTSSATCSSPTNGRTTPRILPRDAMLARYMLWFRVCLSVSVCVCHKSVFYDRMVTLPMTWSDLNYPNLYIFYCFSYLRNGCV